MTTQRALMPDYLRLFALFGIVVVNVQFMAFSFESVTGGAPPVTAIDMITKWLVEGLATMKTYGLFSFMFGVGLGFLMNSAERRGVRFGPIYRRRMIGLFILGVIHGTLFFFGDILAIYAAMGSILYFLRNWSVKSLIYLGIALLVLSVSVGAVFTQGDDNLPKDLVQHELLTMTQGTFVDVFIFRSIFYAIVFAILLFLQGIAALGWFCLGLAAVKSRIINDPNSPIWRKARLYFLFPGLLISLAGAGLMVWGDNALGQLITTLAAPISTVGYLGVIALIATSQRTWLQPILDAGGSSLSIYLGQSIVLSFVFAPYGLGLWGKLSYSAAFGVAVVVTIGLMILLVAWRKRFRLGPFEWILRRFTYRNVAQ